MNPRLLTALLAATCILLVFGCSDDSTDPTGGVAADTDSYLKDLPTWEEFSPQLASEDAATDTSTACLDMVGDQRFLCTETPKSITDTPNDVVTFNAGGDILWPGALIQGATYVGGMGTMLELGIRQRAPLTVSVDLLFPDNSRTVENPTLATVQSAVGELISGADANHESGSAISYKRTVAHSLDHLALKLGLSVKYMGGSARGDLAYESSTETNTVAAYFVQRMFTITIVQPQTPSGFFSSAFNQGLLQEQIDLGRIGPDNLPVYVSQVVYGRMMVMTMTSTRSTTDMMAALKASYFAVRAETQLEDNSVFEESEFTVAAVGGEGSSVMAMLSTGDLADYFAQDASLTTAVPISYTLRNMADNTVASVSETTTYTERTCSNVEVTYCDLESTWRNTVLGAEGDDIFTFVPNAVNIALSQEKANPPGANEGLGTTLTFLGMDTGYPFDFILTKQTPGQFVYNDQERGGNAYSGCSYPHIAPGDADNWEDDDFEVIVPRVDEGICISGIAVNVGHNGTGPEEFLEVYNPRGDLLEQFTEGLPSSTGYTFMGVASPLPLKRIYFNEDAGGDDICFQNIWFSVRLDAVEVVEP